MTMLSTITDQYLPVLVFVAIAAFLSFFMVLLPFIVSKPKSEPAKSAPYECGFPAFTQARQQFDIRFYLVSILFIIFDLEVMLLFPWAIVFRDIGLAGFYAMMVFLLLLNVGLLYEWRKGALDW